jgi:hypothetical protein
MIAATRKREVKLRLFMWLSNYGILTLTLSFYRSVKTRRSNAKGGGQIIPLLRVRSPKFPEKKPRTLHRRKGREKGTRGEQEKE